MSIFVLFFAQGQGQVENKYRDEKNYPSYDERCHFERM
jgi:hypothetical protein